MGEFRPKEVRIEFDTEDDDLDSDDVETLKTLIQNCVAEDYIRPDYTFNHDMETNQIVIHFDFDEVEHKSRFLFSNFTAFGGTAYHDEF